MRGAADLIAELADVPGIETLSMRSGNGTQILSLKGRETVVSANATNDEIRRALNLLKIDKITHGKPMSILGTQSLTNTVKANIQAAKERAQKMAQGNTEALNKVNEAIQVGEQINQSLEDDAASLLKELGQFSNGGPA